jgi:hypothetical protein
MHRTLGASAIFTTTPETSYKRDHNYLTLAADADARRVVFVAGLHQRCHRQGWPCFDLVDDGGQLALGRSCGRVDGFVDRDPPLALTPMD